MVCCTIIAALLGLLIRPFLALRPSPLAWRPGAAGPPSDTPALRAAGRMASFTHAFDGLRFLITNEPNMRIHLGLASVAAFLGVWLRIDAADWRWLILAMASVLAAEALNTATEQACNAISRSYDPAIRAAKDVAAGAVLLTAIAAALIGASVFGPRLLQSPSAPTMSLHGAMCGGTS